MAVIKRNSQRIYYSTGLISLILLPILTIGWLKINYPKKKQPALEITTWNPELNDQFPNIISLEDIHNIKFKTIILTGNEKEDKKSLNHAQMLIRALVQSKDTSKGINFHFGQQSKYWAFIKTIDILKIENAELFLPYNNDIWVFNRSAKNQSNLIERNDFCGGVLKQKIEASKTQQAIEEEDKKKLRAILDMVKTFFAPMLLFILMILFTKRRSL